MPTKPKRPSKAKEDKEMLALMDALTKTPSPQSPSYPVPSSPAEISTSNLKDFLPSKNATEDEVKDLDLSMLNIHATHLYNHLCKGPMSLGELIAYGKEIRDFIQTRRATLGMQYGVQGKTTIVGSIFHHD